MSVNFRRRSRFCDLRAPLDSIPKLADGLRVILQDYSMGAMSVSVLIEARGGAASLTP
jgi:hypothetical protein